MLTSGSNVERSGSSACEKCKIQSIHASIDLPPVTWRFFFAFLRFRFVPFVFLPGIPCGGMLHLSFGIDAEHNGSQGHDGD